MKKINSLALTFILFIFISSSFSQNGKSEWVAKGENSKVFIENKGQFHIHQSNETVLYAYDNGSTMIYFTSKGVTYSFFKRWKKAEKENEREREREREEIKKGKTHAEIEAEEHKMEYKTDAVNFVWANANPNVQVIGTDQTTDYYSYTITQKDRTDKNINFIKGFKKIVYKNIYPNIDIEYVFHPDQGIEYSLILHPGADISKVKMNYSGNLNLKNNCDLHIPTLFGDILEHAPSTFYAYNKSDVISSHFVKSGNTISFSLGAYDHSKTVIVDPWVQTPTGFTNSTCVWECERDATGNVYIIGGESPMKLRKYNSSGVSQWTYTTPWDTAAGSSDGDWLGTLATDLAGNSYVTNGSTAEIQKVNTSGTMVWSNTGSTLNEYWTIAFNCDQTKLIIGGTKTSFGLPPAGYGAIFDMNTSNGNVNSTKIVGFSRTTTVMGLPVTNFEEVRSITSSRNARYYFLTLDTIGAIDQNFSACPAGNLFNINSTYTLGYKCENYRPSNGNAGIKGIKANRNFVYTQNGTTIHKRSLSTGAILGTAAIAGGINVTSMGLNQVGNSGIDIDSCGNVYVGSGNAVIKYDANLNVITSVALPFSVYDVAVSPGGNVIVCGATGNSSSTSRTGYVQSINMSSCDPMTLYCCDATVCPVPPMCSNASAITLTGATSGGTWSGAGVNASTGLFNPATAGPGTHTIIYTLPCGSDSISITVNNCVTLNACQETNGSITVSGGTAPYTWAVNSPPTTTVITNQAECTACGGTWNSFVSACLNGFTPLDSCTTTGGWATFTTGTNATPPGTWPIRVSDASSNIVTITSLGSLPLCSPTSCPPLTATSANIVNVKCYGQSTGSFSVTATGGASPYDYTLMNGSTTVATFPNVSGSQSFTNLPAGTYTLNIADNNACPGTSTIIITQPSSALSATISGTTSTSCGGSNGTATSLGNGGTPGYTYSWAPSGGSAATAANLAAGTYTVTITDANMCSDTAIAHVTSVGGLSATISGTTPTACGSSNGSATSVGTGGSPNYTYSWAPSGGTSATAANLAAGTYTVTITDANTCTATAVATIISTGGPTVTIPSHINVLCFGSATGSATASANGGTGTLTYSWSGGGGNAPTASNLPAGTYTVTVTDAGNCSNTATVIITQATSAISASVSTTPASCGNTDGTATVTASGGTGTLTYSWAGGGTNSSINNVGPGTYTVIVTDANACIYTASGDVVTTGGPIAYAGGDVIIPSGGSTQLSATGGGTYNWAPATGLSCTTCPNPIASPSITTNYCVTVANTGGCSDSACVRVTVELPCPDDLSLPNAFSSNNDGYNDVFELKGWEHCVAEFSIIIYNRWGEKVFESTNPSVNWDGKFNGKPMDPAVFVYYINATTISGQKITKKGNISLIR